MCRRLGFPLLVLLFAHAGIAAAQSVTVPTFTVQSASPRAATSVDLAQGVDGNVLFVWDESQAGLYAFRTALYSPNGSSLPLGPQGTNCCVHHPPFSRVVAYDADGYTRMIIAGETNNVFGLASQMDLLGTIVPNTSYQVDIGQTGTHLAGRGGAVATFYDSAFYLMWDDVTSTIIGRRLNGFPFLSGPPLVAGLSDAEPYISIAEMPGHGVVAGWGSVTGSLPHAIGLVSDAFGTLGASFTLSTDTVLRRVVASPGGDRFALVGTRPSGSASPTEIWGRYFAPDGTPLGADFPIHTAGGGAVVDPDAAFDLAGNLYVVWTEGGTALRALGVAADGTPSGAPVTLVTASGLGGVRTIRLRDRDLQNTGRFMNTWTSNAGAAVLADVASVCTPGTSTCGDGVRVPFCEFCDDGGANDDGAPDACRTDCRPARCGDHVVDAGESCDDGNRDDCDGCNADCALEPALGCGNGLAMPACGEMCDDGNQADGDGCSAICRNELVPGGGAAANDCPLAWSVDNPSNQPRYVKSGTVNPRQSCTDNDPACDFDGGLVGSCTFSLRVCAANSTLAPCVPPARLATWQLEKPSAKDAAKHPDAAQVAAALNGTVPSSIVGPPGPDLCSPPAYVVVPLRGQPGALSAASARSV